MIITLASNAQLEAQYRNLNLTSREDFIKSLRPKFYAQEFGQILKISVCALNATLEEMPKWFLKCNGKIFLTPLKPKQPDGSTAR